MVETLSAKAVSAWDCKKDQNGTAVRRNASVREVQRARLGRGLSTTRSVDVSALVDGICPIGAGEHNETFFQILCLLKNKILQG
jgi:hypothetical protein